MDSGPRQSTGGQGHGDITSSTGDTSARRVGVHHDIGTRGRGCANPEPRQATGAGRGIRKSLRTGWPEHLGAEKRKWEAAAGLVWFVHTTARQHPAVVGCIGNLVQLTALELDTADMRASTWTASLLTRQMNFDDHHRPSLAEEQRADGIRPGPRPVVEEALVEDALDTYSGKSVQHWFHGGRPPLGTKVTAGGPGFARSACKGTGFSSSNRPMPAGKVETPPIILQGA